MKIIVASPPRFTRSAYSLGLPMAHMAYRVGQDMRLYRSEQFRNTRGGLLVVDDVGFSGKGSSHLLMRELGDECASRDFSGVVINFNESCKPPLPEFIRQFTDSYSDRMTVYVPEALAAYAPKAIILISTAISGGTLEARIREAIGRYGKQRVALDIERVRADFTLPAYNGEGVPLAQKDLTALLDKYHSPTFFSEDFHTHYFIYQETGNTHFVLYDDGVSLRSKLSAVEKMGVETSFLYYPEISELSDEIFA